MNKGAQTRKAILNTAHQMASQVGLEGLSLGTLAERMGLSKSGVFAHFGSREELVLALIDEVREEFGRRVFVPAINKPRGLPRLEAIFDGWLSHIANMRGGGCVIVAGASEFDDRPGPVRDRIRRTASELRRTLARAVRQSIEEGHLRTDTDPEQLAFEMHGLFLIAHQDWRLQEDASGFTRARMSFNRLIAMASPFPH
jgi:AcrR family transcriptional regulator